MTGPAGGTAGRLHARSVIDALHLGPVAPSGDDEVDRARERHRRVFLTGLAAGVARGTRLLTALISVPLTIGYLGTERYGLWVAIASLLAMLAFADLGIGNGLLNVIAEAHGRDDRALAARYVSSAFFFLLALATVLGGLLAASYHAIHWAGLFNVTSPLAAEEAGPAAAVFLGCFLVGLPLGVVQRVQLGYQEGFRASLWEALGSAIGLAGVLVAIVLHAGLPLLVLAMAGGPVAALAMNGIVLFGRQRPWLRPRLRLAARDSAVRVLRLGVLFFILQVVMALAFYSDSFVVARLFGAGTVARYAVPAKLFDMVTMLSAMLLTPLWPAYGEAITRGDHAWVRRTLLRSIGGVLVLTVSAGVVLIAIGPMAVRIWAGPAVVPTRALLLALAAWNILSNLGSAVAMFLNGAGRLRFQVAAAVALAVTAISLKVVLGRALGLPGLAWGTALAYLITVALPCAIYVPRVAARFRQAPAGPPTGPPTGPPADAMLPA